jgi:hypothetical protein
MMSEPGVQSLQIVQVDAKRSPQKSGRVVSSNNTRASQS